MDRYFKKLTSRSSYGSRNSRSEIPLTLVEDIHLIVFFVNYRLPFFYGSAPGHVIRTFSTF